MGSLGRRARTSRTTTSLFGYCLLRRAAASSAIVFVSRYVRGLPSIEISNRAPV
jgi:hypothetical protein